MQQDHWQAMRGIEDASSRAAAAAVLNQMIASGWRKLSDRDSAEFFNIVLRLEEVARGVLRDRGLDVFRMIQTDDRSGRRQDQISKAEALYTIQEAVESPFLHALAENRNQDYDTRCASFRILWQRDDVTDVAAVALARILLREWLKEYEREDGPPSGLLMTAAHHLFMTRARTDDDLRMIAGAYRELNSSRSAKDITTSILEKWFYPGTLLVPAPRERG